MKTREDLQQELEELLGSENVYFQPPASVKLHYPCFVYHYSNVNSIRADNKAYVNFNRYEITHIYKNVEGSLLDDILNHFEDRPISTGARQIIDGLYHDYYTLFY